MTTKQRFENKVRKTNSCWVWVGATNGHYGKFNVNGIITSAHRVAYTLYRGPIKGKFVLHKCDNSICVNPYHLFLCTQKDNITDCIGKKRFHSKLTSNQVKSIRKSKQPLKVIADKFNINVPHVSRIRNYKHWAHI